MLVSKRSIPCIPPLRFSHTSAFISVCSLLFACSEVRPLANSQIEKDTPFLHDGITTAQEIEGRLGTKYDSYEGGRIKIYQVYLDQYERLTLARGWPCHALIMVFDDAWVLQRHSLVENGCGNAPR